MFRPSSYIALAALIISSVQAATVSDCDILYKPRYFFGVSSSSPSTTTQLGPNLPGRSPTDYNFKFSQVGNGKTLSSESDLIAYFDSNFPPSTSKPYVEFLYEPLSDQSFSGNTKIDIFIVNDNLPRDGNGKPVPTWDNLKGKTGALVGSFTIPLQNQRRQNFRIGSVDTPFYGVNLRVSISNTGFKSGSVEYPQDYSHYLTGLKLRFAC